MSELGLTQSPQELIPGSASSLREAAMQWGERATAGEHLRAALGRFDARQVWVNEDDNQLYADRLQEIQSYWRGIIDGLRRGARALEEYADVIEWAQGEAADALAIWNEAQRITDAAYGAYQREQAALTTGARQSGPLQLDVANSFADPGEAKRSEARDVLHEAHFTVYKVAQDTASKLNALADDAPVLSRARTTWEHDQQRGGMPPLVAAFLVTAGVAGKPAADAAGSINDAVGALLEHPDILLELLGGVGTFIGGGMTMGGGLLATPAGGLGVAGVAGGGALTAAGGAAVVHAWGRWMNEAGRRRNAQHEGRDVGGRFMHKEDGSNPNQADKDLEQKALDLIEEDEKVEIIRDQKRATIEGLYKGSGPEKQLHQRYYDGLVINQDGERTLTAIEVKIGRASRDRPQRIFDAAIENGHHAVVYIDGERYTITQFRLERIGCDGKLV